MTNQEITSEKNSSPTTPTETTANAELKQPNNVKEELSSDISSIYNLVTALNAKTEDFSNNVSAVVILIDQQLDAIVAYEEEMSKYFDEQKASMEKCHKEEIDTLNVKQANEKSLLDEVSKSNLSLFASMCATLLTIRARFINTQNSTF